MALPSIPQTIHTKHLMGIGKDVHFRSYKNKEQKILLEAKEFTGDNADETQRNALMQVMQMCIIDEDIKVTDLPIFDFIALFIAMRSKSVDNIATLKYTYDWVDDDGEERQSELVINIDLDTINLVFDEENAFDVIDIGSELSIKLKYPSIGFISTLPTDEELVCECIEYIYDAESVYNDFSKEELKAFVEELDVKSILKIQEFMNNAPRIEHIEHVILNDGQKMDIVFNSLTDFFM